MEIIVQMFLGCPSLKSSQHPPLEQGNDKVNTRKQGIASVPKVLNLSIVVKALELSVGIQTVGANGASGLNAFANETMKSFSMEVWDESHADPANPSAVCFSCHDDKGFVQVLSAC